MISKSFMLKERPKYGLIILAQGDKRVGAFI